MFIEILVLYCGTSVSDVHCPTTGPVVSAQRKIIVNILRYDTFRKHWNEFSGQTLKY